MTDLPASTGVSAFTARARRIHLVGFELPCRIGLHAFELDGPQTVRFDITLDIDPGLVPQDDRLDSVVDYDYLR
ncbi:MAG: dihydroneopterin aldolase, partial [Rhodospirillaceae bacterium]